MTTPPPLRSPRAPRSSLAPLRARLAALSPRARAAALFAGVPLVLLALLHLAGALFAPPAAVAPSPTPAPLPAAAAPAAAAAAVSAPASAAVSASASDAAPASAAVSAAELPARPDPAALGAAAARAIAAALTPPEPPLALARRAHPGIDGRLEATLPDGRTARLSLDPALQQRMKALLSDYDVPYAALVAVDPRTGRLLAVVEHAEGAPEDEAGLAERPIAPAASVFKVVTSAALLQKGVSPSTEVCFHGGRQGLSPKLLQPSRRDGRCMSFHDALAHSANVPFARLADRFLDPAGLARVAADFGFNGTLQVDGREVAGSPAKLPETRFEFAEAAAGFNHEVRLSALHGAALAALVGNDGVAMPLSLIEAIDGVEVTPAGAPSRVLTAEVATALDAMMRKTVTEGTARKTFRDRRAPMPGLTVAGKTGSLDSDVPFRDHTWFVGYAPAEAPTIAVAAVVVNGPKWRIRAPFVAREAIRTFQFGTAPYRPTQDRAVAEAPRGNKRAKRGRGRG